MKALILSGGKGTRLKPITHTGAKQLVPVANKPILFYVIENILNAGIKDIGIVISPETGPAIVDAVYNHHTWSTSFKTTFITQEKPLGIAHAVKISREFLGDDNFVVYLGDNLLQAGIKQAVEEFDIDARVFLKKVPNPESFGVATVDTQGKVTKLVEKPVVPESDLALVGVYLFSPAVHRVIDMLEPSARGELEITDALQIMLEEGYGFDSVVLDGWWLDTGKKEDLLTANEMVLDSWAVRETSRATLVGTTTVHGRVAIGDSLISHSTIRGPCVIGDGCTIEHSTINPFTCIGDGSVIIDCKIQSSVLMGNNDVGSVVYLEDSLLAKGAKITAVDCRGTMTASLGEDSEMLIE